MTQQKFLAKMGVVNKATYNSSHLYYVECARIDTMSSHCVPKLHSTSFKLFLKEILLVDFKCAHLTGEQHGLANSLCNPKMEMGDQQQRMPHSKLGPFFALLLALGFSQCHVSREKIKSKQILGRHSQTPALNSGAPDRLRWC